MGRELDPNFSELSNSHPPALPQRENIDYSLKKPFLPRQWVPQLLNMPQCFKAILANIFVKNLKLTRTVKLDFNDIWYRRDYYLLSDINSSPSSYSKFQLFLEN